MNAVAPEPAPRRRRAWQAVGLVPVLCALAALASAAPHTRILFARDAGVPPPVQEFAWRVIESRCNYQPYEREQRSFWAYRARVTEGGAGIVYAISILSELTWKKTEPPAFIEITVVDDGHLRLEALSSSFVVCSPEVHGAIRPIRRGLRGRVRS